MEFRILGPFEVAGDACSPVTPTAPLAQAVLTLLLIARGDVISSERLGEEFWPSLPPNSQRRSLRFQIWSIRKAIEPERASGSDGGVIGWEGHGYRLDLDGHYLDAVAFERKVEAARVVRLSDSEQALATLEQGLGLCRGAPLSHVAYEQFAQAEIRRLIAMRLGAEVLRIELMLVTGRSSEAIVELEGLTSSHPLVERFWCQSIEALVLDGRSSEARSKFDEALAVLATNGVTAPSTALRAAYEVATGPVPSGEVVR